MGFTSSLHSTVFLYLKTSYLFEYINIANYLCNLTLGLTFFL